MVGIGEWANVDPQIGSIPSPDKFIDTFAPKTEIQKVKPVEPIKINKVNWFFSKGGNHRGANISPEVHGEVDGVDVNVGLGYAGTGGPGRPDEEVYRRLNITDVRPLQEHMARTVLENPNGFTQGTIEAALAWKARQRLTKQPSWLEKVLHLISEK